MYWIGDRWHELPTWAKWALGVFALFLIQSIYQAWGERHFVAAVAEFFVANIFHYGVPIGGLFLATWLGSKVYDRTKSNWLAWGVGLTSFSVLVVILLSIGQSIPGVGWRLELMADSDCYVDWDGRSNTTVCE